MSLLSEKCDHLTIHKPKRRIVQGVSKVVLTIQ
uniref:Uncharacterized protein n=1 Tax=Arundo donax TaxID=35708 RepID=A0A0A9F854_ARUDO